MDSSAGTVVPNKQPSQRRKSCDTVCSSSSCLLQKRKSVHPLAAPVCSYIPRTNAVQQRILSARLLKVRTLQNKLSDAHNHLAELQKENKALRNLQTRQDKALSKYEGTNADLPRLLKTYEEDIRVLTTRNKTLRKNLKESADQIKTKDEELMGLREQLKTLNALIKNKNLGERQMLAEQVDDLKDKLKTSDEKINLLNRKLLLESKNHKLKLNAEIVKNKQKQKDMSQALGEIDRLNSLVEGRTRVAVERKRFSSSTRQSMTLANVVNDKIKPKLNVSIKMNTTKVLDEDEIELPNIQSDSITPTSEKHVTISSASTITSPTDNFKSRFSSKITKEIELINKTVAELDLRDHPEQSTVFNQAQMLDELRDDDDLTKDLEEYCHIAEKALRDCHSKVEKHKDDFHAAETNMKKILKTFKETEEFNDHLQTAKFISAEKIQIPEQDLDIAKEIWSTERSFRKETEVKNGKHRFLKPDRNGNVVTTNDVDIKQEDKYKLLATMRAIDNDEYDFTGTSHEYRTNAEDSLTDFSL